MSDDIKPTSDPEAAAKCPCCGLPPGEKLAPVQGFQPGIPWSMHLRAYDAYCKRYSPQQALIEGWCRGGFHTSELDVFIPGWREELSVIKQQSAELARLRAEVQALREDKAMLDWCESNLYDAEAYNDHWLVRFKGCDLVNAPTLRDAIRSAMERSAE